MTYVPLFNVIKVATIAALRTIAVTDDLDGTAAEVAFYSVAGDQGGGFFVYDKSKKTTDNGGTIVGGWVRQYTGALNVRWFGAKGDGATTLYATNYSVGGYNITQQTADGLAINKAIVWLRAQGIGALYFPGGTYMTHGFLEAMDFTWSNVFGDGKGVSVIKCTASSPANISGYGIFWFRNTGSTLFTCSIATLTLDGNTDNRGTHTEVTNFNLSFQGKIKVTISTIESINASLDCLYLDMDSADISSQSVKCENSFFDYSFRNTISIANGHNMQFVNCDFNRGGRPGSTGTNPRACMDIEPIFDADVPRCQNLQFNNCRFFAATGVQMIAVQQAEVEFTNCIIRQHPTLGGNELIETKDSIVDCIGCKFVGGDAWDNRIIQSDPTTEYRGFYSRLALIGCDVQGAGLNSVARNTIVKSTTFRNCTWGGLRLDKTNDPDGGVWKHAITVKDVELINCIDCNNSSAYHTVFIGSGASGPFDFDGLNILFDPNQIPDIHPSFTLLSARQDGFRNEQTPLTNVSYTFRSISVAGYVTDLPVFVGVPPSADFRDWGSPNPAPPDTSGEIAKGAHYYRSCTQRGANT